MLFRSPISTLWRRWLHFRCIHERRDIEGEDAENQEDDDRRHEAPDRKIGHHRQGRQGRLRLLFILLRQPAHRLDQPTTLLGHFDFMDEVFRKNSAAAKRLVDLTARADLLDDLVGGGEFLYVCHGHTHCSRDERIGNVRVICPGALYGPRDSMGSRVAQLDTINDEVLFLQV